MNGIIKADERRKKTRHINITLLGPFGVGKTTQATTLPADTTLFVDLEAGDLALGNWKAESFDAREFATQIGAHPWEICRALALYIGGPDPAESDPAKPYSQATYEKVCELFGDPSYLDRFEFIFVDSITVASRWAFSWAQTQPGAFSEKTGAPDTRGAYRILGEEMVTWITHMQHAPKSVILSGILERHEDDLKRVTYAPQIEGSKTGREMPGIFDVILAMDYLTDERGKAIILDGKKVRAFFPTADNPQGYPSKDRSGTLEMTEPPNLGDLIAKIRAANRIDQTITTLPENPTTEPDA